MTNSGYSIIKTTVYTWLIKDSMNKFVWEKIDAGNEDDIKFTLKEVGRAPCK